MLDVVEDVRETLREREILLDAEISCKDLEGSGETIRVSVMVVVDVERRVVVGVPDDCVVVCIDDVTSMSVDESNELGAEVWEVVKA